MHLGAEKGVGRMGFKTMLYYTFSGAVAVIVGLIVVNLIGPGRIDAETATAMLGRGSETALSEGLMSKVEGRSSSDLFDIFLRMFPSNIVDAATNNGQLLGVITFSLLFGVFIGKLKRDQREAQQKFWESTQEVMLKLTDFIIRFAPIGVFGLVTPILFNAPIADLFGAILWFFITVLLALAIHFIISLGLVLKFVGKVNPVSHYKAMTPVLLTAFSTASSSATLPLTIDTVEERAKVSKKTCSFTLPLGATVNMDGTALYECVVVLFIAQLYASTGAIALGIGDQLLVVFLALTTSIGVAGIPAASLVAISVILPAVGLPVEAIGVVWVTDRILDMCRTSVNVFSDTVGAVAIARSEGEVPYGGES
jgi:Na+/H+-dicarboxylate symporter